MAAPAAEDAAAVTGVERIEVEAGGLVFSALAAGPLDGRPALLLHGFPQTSACFAEEVVALGAAGHRAVAPDQRGYSTGARPLDVGAYAVPFLVSDVLAIAGALGMDRFDLVGHDWGGLVAWTVAARHPGCLRTLTAVSTPHPEALAAVLAAGDEDQVRRSAYIDLFRQAGTPERVLLGEDGSGDGLRRMFAATGLEAARAEPHVRAMCEPGRLSAALDWYRANDLHRPGPVGAVAVPTLYVWSTGDTALGRAAAEVTAGRVTGPYRFEELEGVSHWIPEVAPERLHGLLGEHLDRYR